MALDISPVPRKSVHATWKNMNADLKLQLTLSSFLWSQFGHNMEAVEVLEINIVY